MKPASINVLLAGGLLVTCAAGRAAAQHLSILEPEQEAHRPYQRLSTPSNLRPSGYTPQQMRHAYGLDQVSSEGEGQVIGIVDAYDYVNAESDLQVFSAAFNLPACTKANGCLTVVYADGQEPPPNRSWTGESSLDIQWAHAIAPLARIVLVLTPNGTTTNLLKGVPIAVQNGATVVSMSWGTNTEFRQEQSYDPYVFNNPAVTYFNASGNNGFGFFGYPAASPLVVGVGGTTLRLDPNGRRLDETAWSYGGGGLSFFVDQPVYQASAFTFTKRGIPDVAYDADPDTGVPVFDSEDGLWSEIGGTSAGSPQVAAIAAIANSLRAASGKAPIGNQFLNVIYAHPEAFRDILRGNNGHCGPLCAAWPGYDFTSGLGSPRGEVLIGVLASAP